MGKTYAFNKTSYFINPWVDIIFLTGFPIVLLVIYLLNYLRLYFLSIFSVLFSYWFARFILPHFFVTFGAVYLDREEWRPRLVQFLSVPLLLSIATIILSILGHFNLVTTILFYAITWHILAQNYYILQLHKLRNQDYLRLDNIIDNITLILGPVYFLLKSLPHLKFNYIGGIVYTISINLHILNYLRIFTWLSVVVFILRQIYLFIKWKRINIFKISMIFMTILSFYLSLVLVKNMQIFIMGVFRWHHNIQYILWVWFYHRQKFKTGITKGARLISYLSQSGRAGLYILFFMLLSMVASLVAKVVLSLTINATFTAAVIQSIIVCLHVYLDIFIWKIPKIHSIINT